MANTLSLPERSRAVNRPRFRLPSDLTTRVSGRFAKDYLPCDEADRRGMLGNTPARAFGLPDDFNCDLEIELPLGSYAGHELLMVFGDSAAYVRERAAFHVAVTRWTWEPLMEWLRVWQVWWGLDTTAWLEERARQISAEEWGVAA